MSVGKFTKGYLPESGRMTVTGPFDPGDDQAVQRRVRRRFPAGGVRGQPRAHLRRYPDRSRRAAQCLHLAASARAQKNRHFRQKHTIDKPAAFLLPMRPAVVCLETRSNRDLGGQT